MAPVQVGDRVQVADREATAADAKSGLFYAYLGRLTGRVERIYDDKTVCLDVELESLPEDVRVRHIEMQTAARDRWINSLSQEQRSRLTEKDKQFRMSYKVLVAASDLQPLKGGPKTSTKAPSAPRKDRAPKAVPAQSSPVTKRPAAPKAAAGTGKPAPRKGAAQPAKDSAAPAKARTTAKPKASEEAGPRLTQSDLEAKEMEYLKSLGMKSRRGSAPDKTPNN